MDPEYQIIFSPFTSLKNDFGSKSMSESRKFRFEKHFKIYTLQLNYRPLAWSHLCMICESNMLFNKANGYFNKRLENKVKLS